MGDSQLPVRACCGQRHAGAQCPDGTFMCCICFDKVAVADAYVDTEGVRWDMCGACGENETKEADRG